MIIFKLFKRYKLLLIYIVIFFIAFLIRIHNLSLNFPFTMDEEYQAFLALDIIQNHHIPLIGVNVADTGIYLGPLFTWLTAILYSISHGNPLIGGVMSAILGGITSILIVYIVGVILKTKITSKIQDAFILIISISSGLMYALNPLVNLYDRKYWNPSLVPLLSVLWVLSMIKVQKNTKWLIGISLVFSLALHTHFSLFGFVIPTLAMFVYLFSKGKNYYKGLIINSKKNIILAIAIFVVLLSPLLIFELRHNFVMTKGVMSRYFQSNVDNIIVTNQTFWDKKNIIINSFNRFIYFGINKDISLEFSKCQYLVKQNYIYPLFYIFILMIIFLIFRKKYLYEVTLILLSILSISLSLLFFPSIIAEYYLLPLFPLLIILIGMFIYEFIIFVKLNYFRYLVGLIMFILLISWTYQSYSIQNTHGLQTKIILIQNLKSKYGGIDYYLDVKSNCFRFEGYRYLTQWQGFTPVASYMDIYLDWLYGKGSDNWNIVLTIDNTSGEPKILN